MSYADHAAEGLYDVAIWAIFLLGEEEEEERTQAAITAITICAITIIAITDGISVTPDCDKCDISCSSGKIGNGDQVESRAFSIGWQPRPSRGSLKS